MEVMPVALELIRFIVNRAEEVRRNKEECRQLACRAKRFEDLLPRLLAPEMAALPEAEKAKAELEVALRRGRDLVKKCSSRNFLRYFFSASSLADGLRAVHNDLDRINGDFQTLLQGVTYVDHTRLLKRILNKVAVAAKDGVRGEQEDSSFTSRMLVQSFTSRMLVQYEVANELRRHQEVGDTAQSPGSLPEHQRSWGFSIRAAVDNIDISVGHNRPPAGLTKFTFTEIVVATKHFSLDNQIAIGGFSAIYKGKLREDLVAIKRASFEWQTPFDHFESELELIPKLRHTNIVKLLGYCIQKRERILVFEYMPNKSLDTFIYGARAAEAPLDWPKRSHIIEGIAQGALYLHELCGLRIIHGDLKPGNILLDSDLNPKICDFGISKALKPGVEMDHTSIVAGSRGFIAPEYNKEGCLSFKSDVYSFGAMILQIIGGKKFPPPPLALPVIERDYGPLNKWVWDLWHVGRIMEFVDPSLNAGPHTAEIKRCIQIALLCVQESRVERPSMSDVVLMLGCKGKWVNLQTPNQPAYY